MKKIKYGELCFRCEHRAVHLESKQVGAHYQPRCECGEIEQAKYACYMYQPVRPVILKKMAGDRRPCFAPALFSAREFAVGISNMRLYLRREGGGVVLYYAPGETKKCSTTKRAKK